MTFEAKDVTDIQGMINASVRDLHAILQQQLDRRFIDTHKRIDELEVDIHSLQGHVTKENEKALDAIEKGDNRVYKAVDEIKAVVNDMRKTMEDSKSSTLRYIVSVIVSFVIGSGLIVALFRTFILK